MSNKPAGVPVGGTKTKRSRKGRTRTRTDAVDLDISSSSSSSESSSDGEAAPRKRTKKSEDKSKAPKSNTTAVQQSPRPTAQDSSSVPSRSSPTPDQGIESEQSNTVVESPSAGSPQVAATEDLFENWYLRAVTKQFANDLERLRSAPDFKDSSVPILIKALKQGAGLFDHKQRDRLIGIAD